MNVTIIDVHLSTVPSFEGVTPDSDPGMRSGERSQPSVSMFPGTIPGMQTHQLLWQKSPAIPDAQAIQAMPASAALWLSIPSGEANFPFSSRELTCGP
ncbi:MAG: hypothetical protein JW705_01410 [Methanosarcinaceae archaeon]|nr:hypothetical protein [Methanosarcinaceae archaeon]